MSASESPARTTALRWTVHPAADNPGRAVLVGLVVLIAGLFAAGVSGSVALGWLGALLLLFSVRAFFLPRTYELDAEGAREAGPLCRAHGLTWSQVRAISKSRFGVHLSPLHRAPRLLPDHGLFLRTAGNEQQVTEFARRHRAGAP